MMVTREFFLQQHDELSALLMKRQVILVKINTSPREGQYVRLLLGKPHLTADRTGAAVVEGQSSHLKIFSGDDIGI
jgi:hypothetical protein